MSTTFEAVGKLHHLSETRQVTDTFRVREFVLEIEDGKDGRYNQFVKFQVAQDRCSILDSYRVGQQTKVFFNLRGKKYENKDGQTSYFNSLDVWRIEAAGAPAPATTDYSQISPANPGAKDDFDDVPF
jgi:single-strand DNA-binding protein